MITAQPAADPSSPDPTNAEIVRLEAELRSTQAKLDAATARAPQPEPETETEKRSARTRLETEILYQLVSRMAGNGGFHIDTDTIDLTGERDFHHLSWLSRVVTTIVEGRTRTQTQELRCFRALAKADCARDASTLRDLLAALDAAEPADIRGWIAARAAASS